MSRMYNTRSTFHVSFEHQLEWKVGYQFKDEEMVPCFKMKFMDNGLLSLKNNVFVRDIYIICYVGSTLGERLNSIQVSQDISFSNFILLLLASINDTRAIIINEISYYINAKCKIYIDVPNNLHKWFKVKCYKRRLYVMKRLTVHLSKIGLQYN